MNRRSAVTVEEWQSSDADAFVDDHGHGADGKVVEVFEDDRDLLFCGSVVATSKQDDRGWLPVVQAQVALRSATLTGSGTRDPLLAARAELEQAQFDHVLRLAARVWSLPWDAARC